MHYYINGSRTGDGKCFRNHDAALAGLIRIMAAKLEHADNNQAIEVAEGMSIVAGWRTWHHSDVDDVTVGSDTWRIIECVNYSSCTDTATGDW